MPPSCITIKSREHCGVLNIGNSTICQQFVYSNINGNIKARITGHLWIHWWPVDSSPKGQQTDKRGKLFHVMTSSWENRRVSSTTIVSWRGNEGPCKTGGKHTVIIILQCQCTDRYIHPLKDITNAAYHACLIWYIFEMKLAPYIENVVQ